MKKISDKILANIIQEINESKLENVQIYDLQNKSSVVDYMVVATGTSVRQLNAVSDRIVKSLKSVGYQAYRITEGEDSWSLVDAENIYVHLLLPEVREYYDLDSLFAEGHPW